jgi:DNA-binding NarL/FixJ family response regulator
VSDNGAVGTRTESVTVLLVEDDDRVRSGLRGWLAATFPAWSFREAGTGEKAMSLAQVMPPDLVFMDIGLPGINGIEATRRITAIAPQARVVMLSIHECPEYQADAAAAGASAYVPKRTMHRDLIPAVKRLLSHVGTPPESDPAPGEERRGERQDDA